MSVRLGVDTGGTFTDVVLYDTDTGAVTITKTPSTPPEFDRGVLTGIDKILDRTETEGGAVEFLSHGTTVGTNAVLEGEIPDIGLVTNEGLRDVLEIGDQTRPELYNLQTEKPPALVPRYLRREVPGRIDSSGEVVDSLDEERAREVAADLSDEGVESVVVSMLFSYLDGEHEERVGDILAEAGLDYALSSAVHPEIREYDRTITTVLNEAIKTTVEEYFSKLDEGIAERDIDAPLNVMHSGGGVFSTEQATENAIRTVLSGPAAGAVAAREVGADEGFENAVGMDMGGTSADVSIVRDGELVRSTEGEIDDLPVKTPMIDVNTVGAGGGSIAWIDEGGGLRVGPRSAGADPGPVCYDRGGTDPTLTDANLLLGRINPDYFLDGEMDLAVERTRDRFAEAVAEPLDLSVEEAALSVAEVANASLAREIRRVTVERGNDPGEFALVAFGGAGPLQAPRVAREMDMNSVVVPRNPGVLSARGLLVADVRIDEAQAYAREAPDADVLADHLADLEAALLERVRGQGHDADDADVERAVDARYAGQSYELTVAVPDGEIDASALESIVESFHETHASRYGHAMRDEPVEFVTLRANATVPTPDLRDEIAADEGDAHRGDREVYFPDAGYVETDIYDRTALSTGDVVEGPAVLEESGSTAVVPPETRATVTEAGSLIVEL
ncbi:hydantoinase/oxoprolinase family protein [Halorussus salinisoli]|uniref:hydantoinase/oxoprolinase family protein n=1 Tax=Halorussus salinisoli TaxID=2558242 RepID=UPI0010C1EA60|nr:hydantoinase/oxoprolinase family protein [Halorussus salinisoli]